MKKLFYILLTLAAVLFVVYRVVNRPPSAELTPEAKVLAILNEGGCLSCHSAEPELPFYAKLPLAGDMVMADVEEGYRAFDIEPLMASLNAGELPRPVDVAKLEKVALDRSMPVAKYYLVHWGSQTTNAKRDIAREWANDYRTAYYADGLEGKRAGEPVRGVARGVFGA